MTQTTIAMPAQHRNKHPESRTFHGWVLTLRKKGHRVLRQGKWCCVDGKRLSWREVRKMARAVR